MQSIAKTIVEHDKLGEIIFNLYTEKISQECGSLCRRTVETLSPFRKIPVDQLTKFQWSCLIQHLSTEAPHLLSLFSAIVTHHDHRNKKKTDSAHFPGICMATAILLKERSREMCGVQSIISTMLYGSHVNKQVSISLKYISHASVQQHR